MKKTILFIVLVATMGCGNLQAQDTIWQKTAPLSNYFSNRWIDTTERYTTDIGGYALSHCSARQFFTQDTLQIYGIAAMMMNPDSFFFVPSSYYPNLQALLNASYPNDPTFNNCEESLMLYQYNESDTILMHQLGEALPVHLLHTPVSCYMMTNRPPVSNWDPYPKPIYERYFSSPQTVYDTFYVGVTDYEWDYVKPSCEPRNLRSPFMCVYICYPDQRDLDEVMAVHLQTDCEGTCIWRFYRDYIHSIPFLFPIIAPPDTTVNPGDTIINGGDTTGVGIQGVNLLYRYTSVQPNPATNKVRVTSSFGLTRIEAYDLRGRLLFETPASGLKADLDVSSWPRGTYLLRIFTPAGPTTKKLLIQ